MTTRTGIYLAGFFFFNLFLACNTWAQKGHLTQDENYKITSDSTGIYTHPIDFQPEKLYFKKSWTGNWIWLKPAKFPEFQETQFDWKQNPRYKTQYRALFRKTFDLEEAPDQALLSLTADVSFRVYINGTFVAQGPANVGHDYDDAVAPQHWFYGTHQVNGYLKPGSNTLAVEVYSHSKEISETSSGIGLFICDLEDGEGRPIVYSDASWKTEVDTSFTAKQGVFGQNSLKEVRDWNQSNFDDSSWETAAVRNFPKDGYLIPSQIPVPFRHPIYPKRVWMGADESVSEENQSVILGKQLTKAEFTFDYDRNITAYYGFEIEAHQNDTLKIYPYEKKQGAVNRPLTFVCKAGTNVFYAPYLSVFRYLKFETNSVKGIIIRDLRADFSTYPVSYTGNFSCSDPKLTRLWDITKWTTQLCMNDMYYDSPKHQEPIACTGDYLIESLINYYAFGDPWLTRQTLVKTALMLEKNKYDMFHTSYSLLWVQMIRQYYQYTGDIQLVREMVPHVNQLTQLFETYLDKDYLVSNAPDYMFMDWIKIDRFNAHHPPAVIGTGYMTAFYYKSLQDAAFLNDLVSKETTAEKNLKLAQNIKKGMNDLLWDKEKLRFKDGLPFRSQQPNHFFFPPDTTIVTYSPHVNTLAVLYDIAPKEQVPQLIDYVLNQKSIDLQPYFMFFVLSSIQHADMFDSLGLNLLKKWENGINLETYTLKENWQDVTETGYGGDYSHAWGGSPLYFLSSEVLGVKPGVQGYSDIEIRPFESEKISWAKGRVPLMDGNTLGISWKRNNVSTYEVTLDVPEGFDASLVIPESKEGRAFKLNNILYPDEVRRVQVTSGTYTLEF